MNFVLHPQLAADTAHVASLALCEVRLMEDARYPWLILVPRRDGLRDLIDLDEADQATLIREIAAASRALRDAFDPHKLNVAALGNQVAQLHVHVIARRTDDAAWPNPVWGRGPAQPYDASERDARMARIFRAVDCPFEVVGVPTRIGRTMTYAGLFEISDAMRRRLGSKAGLTHPVLSLRRPRSEVPRRA